MALATVLLDAIQQAKPTPLASWVALAGPLPACRSIIEGGVKEDTGAWLLLLMLLASELRRRRRRRR